MNWLADNALVIWISGAVALTLAVVVFLQTRSGKALAAIAAVLAITAMLLVTEQILETPREAVERTLYQLAATCGTYVALSHLVKSSVGAIRAKRAKPHSGLT